MGEENILQSSIDFDFFDLPIGEDKTEATASINHTHKCKEDAKKKQKELHAIGESTSVSKGIHRVRKQRDKDVKNRHSSGDSVEFNSKASNLDHKSVKNEGCVESQIPRSNKIKQNESDSDLDSITDSESGSTDSVGCSGKESVTESDDVTDVSPLSSSLSSIPSSVCEEDDNDASLLPKVKMKPSQIIRHGKLTEESGRLANGMKPESDKRCRFNTPSYTEVDDMEELGLMLDTVLKGRTKCHSRCSNSSQGGSSHSLRSASTSSCSGSVGMSPRVAYSMNRKNLSFTNDDVKKIDKENQRLLKIINEKRMQPVKTS